MADPSPQTHRRRTGQFYTPPEVARFLLELLIVTAPDGSGPGSVIDPACGKGVFLEAALDVFNPPPERVVGVDLYPQEGGIWGEDARAGVLQLVGDGLLVPGHERYDLVAGNPPFHGDALRCLADPDDPRSGPLAEALARRFDLWRGGVSDPGASTRQLAIPGTEEEGALSARTAALLSRYPIELVFLDRFVKLCRPGGFVVIVLPEGVVANRRLQYVRDWVRQHCRVLAVVSLPRGTFRKSGTSAVTATLILQRRSPEDRTRGRTLLLDVERLDRLDGLLDDVRESLAGEGDR